MTPRILRRVTGWSGNSRVISGSVGGVLLPALLLTSPLGAQEPCADTPGFDRLDFWVGEWNVLVDGRQVGTNRITRILDGCAVSEEWVGQGGSRGRSLFYYLPQKDEWKQVWVTTTATRTGGVKEKSLVEELDDGSLRFQGTVRASDGAVWQDRTTLTPLDGGRVRQLIEISPEGTEWQTTFDAVYVPS